MRAPHPQQVARAVDGRVAAADDRRDGLDVQWLPGGQPGEKIDAGVTALQLLTGHREGAVLPCADAHEDGVVAVGLEGFQVKVLAETKPGAHLDAQVEDALDLPVEHLLGQPVLRDPVAQHAAQLGHGLEDGDAVAQPPQEIGTGEAGRTAADHGDAFARVRRHPDGQPFAGGHFEVGGKAFELIDRDRLVRDAAAAVELAGVRADAAAGEQQRVALADGVHRAGIVARADLMDVERDVDLGRAGLAAGRQAVPGLVEVQQPLGGRADLEQALGAGPGAGPAAHAFLLVDDGVAVRPHGDGVERAGPHAVAVADAADPADAFAAEERGLGLAGGDPEIEELVFRPVAAGARVEGFRRFDRTDLHPHDRGRILGGFQAADDARVGFGLAADDRRRGRRAAGKPAPAAVGAGEAGLHLGDAGVLVNVKDAGGDAEHDAADRAQCRHEKNAFQHKDSLFLNPFRRRGRARSAAQET